MNKKGNATQKQGNDLASVHRTGASLPHSVLVPRVQEEHGSEK